MQGMLLSETSDYSYLGRLVRRAFRKLFPIPSSPKYSPKDDICSVRLVPREKMTDVFRSAIAAIRPYVDNSAYLEFGVFNGTSMSCMIAAADDQNIQAMEFVGLDSFEGLPSTVTNEDGGVWHAGQFACSRSDTLRCLNSMGVDSKRITFVEGWYNEISISYVAQVLDGKKASIILIDCDAYSSAARALQLITPFLAEKCIIFFDDWRLQNVDLLGGGEFRAFNEWRAKNNGFKVRKFKSYNRKSEAFLITRKPE